MKKTLSIAGFDPTGWAGLLADTGVFTDLGVAALAVPTALTVQDLESVSECRPVEAKFFSRQLSSVLNNHAIDAVKIGMLGSGAVATAAAKALQKSGPAIIVLDPVMSSTGGAALIDEAGIEVMRKALLPLCTLVTPNIKEASMLTGREITDTASMRSAAEDIYNNLKAKAVLVKGGHLQGIPTDILFDGREFTEFKGLRIRGPGGLFHGTGCLLSSAITAGLAKGLSLKRAVKQGKNHTEKILLQRKKCFFMDEDRG